MAPARRAFDLSTKDGWAAYCHAQLTPPEPPDDLKQRAFMQLTEQARKQWRQEVLRHHANLGPFALPSQRSLRAELDERVERSELRCDGAIRPALVLDALPYVGKTTLLRRLGVGHFHRLMELHGPLTEEGNEHVPVVWLPFETGMRALHLNSRILRFFGLPVIDRENQHSRRARVTDALLDCGTRLVLVDDLHWAIKKSDKGLELTEVLKSLMGMVPVTILGAGVQLEQTILFNEGYGAREVKAAQFAERSYRFPLENLEVSTADGRRAWEQLMVQIDSAVRILHQPPGLRTRAVAKRLFERSSGQIGRTMEIAEGAALRALDRNIKAKPGETGPITVADIDAIRLTHGGARDEL